MAIRYSEALGILKQVAVEIAGHEDGRDIEEVGLEDAIGRIAGADHVSQTARPPFDIAATDGYAISSAATANATKKRPVTFVVKGTVAASDEPTEVPADSGSGIPSCYEIMAGVRFPSYASGEGPDACVKLEDVVLTAFGSQKMITVVEPVPKNANRRFAASDLQAGHKILAKGEKIQPRHIMALASAGVTTATIRKRLRIAVYCTGGGNDSQRPPQTMDANGLFLLAALRELSVDAQFMGALKDNKDGLSEALSQQTQHGVFDAILFAGAVSDGNVDSTPPALKTTNARIRFQGVSIRPGNSVLLATLPTAHGEMAFFGLPGDPMATAACFRFLVVPFIKQLSGFRHDVPKVLRMQAHGYQDLAAFCPPHCDYFKHGRIQRNERGEEVVQLSSDQNPWKVSHFSASDCWVHISRGHSGSYRDTLVYCYNHDPDTSA